MDSIKKFFKKFKGHKEMTSSDTFLPFRDWGVILLISVFLFLALVGGGVWFFHKVNTPPQAVVETPAPSQKINTKEEILSRLGYLEEKKAAFEKLKAGIVKATDPSL